MKQEEAKRLLEETRETYDAVAKEFSDSRAQFWPELAYLAEHAREGTRVLDIGCGNGRLLSVLPRGVDYVGLDFSKELLAIAQKRYPGNSFVEGDATRLPFADKEFGTVFSFAALHHIPSRALRETSLREIARVLAPGGTLVLTVWSLWQKGHLPELLGGILRALMHPFTSDIGDVLLTLGSTKGTRYLHGFTQRGLARLLKRCGFMVIGTEVVARGREGREQNLVVVAQRTANGK